MEYDVVIIGGGAGGEAAAMSTKTFFPKKSILVIKETPRSVPWGIPYMFSTLDHIESATHSQDLVDAGVTILCSKAHTIDPKSQTVACTNGERIRYERLILALGSSPKTLHIPGGDKMGIYCISKDPWHLENLRSDVHLAKHIAVIGGGFIGVEFAEELAKIPGKKINIIESQPRILGNSFDEEFSSLATKELEKAGVMVSTGTKILSITGNERVTGVETEAGIQLADLCILGIGDTPNIELAQKAGLTLTPTGAIDIDDFGRTSNPHIFAVGDCASKKDFITGQPTSVMLASTAAAEGRLTGANIFKKKLGNNHKGTIATYSTPIGGLILASAGHSEQSAKKHGIEVYCGRAKTHDHHPVCLPETHTVLAKLIFTKDKILIGGQIAGGKNAAELINVIGVAIQNKMSMADIQSLQVATHPKLTSIPTNYPLISAAFDAQKHIRAYS